VSQNIEDKANAAEVNTQETRSFMQQVRVASRRKYTPEEKIRIVLEGFRREVAVNELCRREGIKPGAYVSEIIKEYGDIAEVMEVCEITREVLLLGARAHNG